MSSEINPLDQELAAMQSVVAAFEPLHPDARKRVFDYVIARLGLSPVKQPMDRREPPSPADSEQPEVPAQSPEFATFAELHDAAQPATQADSALVAGYWLQVVRGGESFEGFAANKELKNLGEGASNITASINVLKNQNPALVIQLKKSGTSKQARKTYKVTVAGIKRVQAMMREAAGRG